MTMGPARWSLFWQKYETSALRKAQMNETDNVVALFIMDITVLGASSSTVGQRLGLRVMP